MMESLESLNLPEKLWIAVAGHTKRIAKNFSQLAEEQGYNPAKLLLAIAAVESSFNPFACRYESHYTWLYRPEEYAMLNGITILTEAIMQKTSWGYFQLMGAVLRELGYNHPLHLMATPDTTNTQALFACKHLERLTKAYAAKGIKDIPVIISGYNAGFGLKEPTRYWNRVKNYYDRIILEE